MLIAGLDVETTGVDPDKDHVVEVAVVVKEVGNPRPVLAESYYLRDPAWGDTPIPEAVTAVHGITNERLRRYATVTPDAYFTSMASFLQRLGVGCIVAHNAAFDRAMVVKYAPDLGTGYQWICTLQDVDYPPSVTARKLGHVAAELGFLNPFPHTALADVLTTLRILEAFDFEKTLSRAMTPSVMLRALVSFDDKDKAKQRGYRWEKWGDKTFPKAWIKQVKECDVARELEDSPFEVLKL